MRHLRRQLVLLGAALLVFPALPAEAAVACVNDELHLHDGFKATSASVQGVSGVKGTITERDTRVCFPGHLPEDSDMSAAYVMLQSGVEDEYVQYGYIEYTSESGTPRRFYEYSDNTGLPGSWNRVLGPTPWDPLQVWGASDLIWKAEYSGETTDVSSDVPGQVGAKVRWQNMAVASSIGGSYGALQPTGVFSEHAYYCQDEQDDFEDFYIWTERSLLASCPPPIPQP